MIQGVTAMFHYDYKTKGTCSQIISMDLDGDRVKNVRFLGGCDGNLKAISTLVDGWTVEEIAEKLSGITCGRKSTSCGDQLACAVRSAYQAELQSSR